MWDCGSAQCLRTFETSGGSSCVLNNCRLSQYQSQVSTDAEVENHGKEFGTENKLLLLAREDGFLDGVDLYSKENVFSLPCYSAVNDCCFVNEHHVVVGLQDGLNVFYDIRNTRAPERIFKHGKSPIHCVEEFPGESVLMGRGDGSCSCVRLTSSSTQEEMTTMELSGPNCDPVYSLSHHDNFVYTGCRDNQVRKYKLQLTE